MSSYLSCAHTHTHTPTDSGKQYTFMLGDQECTVAGLLEELYQKAGISKLWSLVRHAAGMLQKRVDHLGAVSGVGEGEVEGSI